MTKTGLRSALNDIEGLAAGGAEYIDELRECNRIGCEPPEELIENIGNAFKYITRTVERARGEAKI